MNPEINTTTQPHRLHRARRMKRRSAAPPRRKGRDIFSRWAPFRTCARRLIIGPQITAPQSPIRDPQIRSRCWQIKQANCRVSSKAVLNAALAALVARTLLINGCSIAGYMNCLKGGKRGQHIAAERQPRCMDLPVHNGLHAGKYFLNFAAAEPVDVSARRVLIFRDPEDRQKPHG